MDFLIGVLVTFNRPQQVSRTVRAIARQERDLDRLIVIDNSTQVSNAAEECRKVWEGQPGPLTWHSTGFNAGPAGGYEFGMHLALSMFDAASDSWVVLFDDDDPPPSPTILSELEESAAASRADAVGILGSVLNRRTGLLSRPSTGTQRFADVDQIGNGRLPIYRLAALLDVGPMRGDLFFGREELELGLRLRKSNYRVVIDQDLRARYEPLMGKEVRPAVAGRVPVRDGLARRTALNHLRIIRTHVGSGPFLTASLLMIGADAVRLVVAVRSHAVYRAFANLAWTIRNVTVAVVQGRLPDVAP